MRHPVRVGDIEVPARWLRDHGDDPASIDPESRQRVVDTFAIPRDIEAVSVDERDGVATIGWTDGATTTHDIDALRRVAAAPRSPAPAPSSDPFTLDPELTRPGSEQRLTFAADVIDDDRAWPEALEQLRRLGWVAFDGAALGPAPVEALARRVGYPRTSLFGTIWEMKPGPAEHKDSAYDPIALDVHTDGTYSHDAPGTIIFAQQEKDGAGGDSVMVDGFAVARDLAAADPASAELLTRYEITGRYLEPGVSLRADRVPIRVDSLGVLRQVSFNNYDRAPVLPAAPFVDDVLDAYAAFRRLMNDPARAIRLTWAPGRMLLVDNWRMFHGRTHYTGNRVFLGCYTNHEDLESAYRVAGLDD